MNIYNILDKNDKKLYSIIENIVSDYKIDDITLSEAVSEIYVEMIKYSISKNNIKND